MKKLLFPVMMVISITAFAQSVVKNGTIYREHPYITAVKEMNADFAKGDTTAVINFYADTVRFIDATGDSKPYNLAQARAQWQSIFKDWTVDAIKMEGYPDGLEYASDPFTVQSWWEVSVVDKKTQKKAVFEEVVFDTFNKDGKISMELSYYDTSSLEAAMK